jgi:hypothetical protein
MPHERLVFGLDFSPDGRSLHFMDEEQGEAIEYHRLDEDEA